MVLDPDKINVPPSLIRPMPPPKLSVPPEELAPPIGPAPACQLLKGKPTEELIARVWGKLFGSCPDSLPPYDFHWQYVQFIRKVVLTMKDFASDYRHYPDPFFVRKMHAGRVSLDVRPEPFRFFALFLSSAVRQALAVVAHFPGQKFHPIFQIYVDALLDDRGGEESGDIELLANHFFTSALDEKHSFFSPRSIQRHCDRLNKLCKIIYERMLSEREKIKTFERLPKDTRLGVMRYAEHLISDAPKPYIGRLAIFRSPDGVINRPVSHNEIRSILTKLTRTLRTRIPPDIYLGYSILLRHNAQIGFWLDVFVYLRNDDILRRANTSLEGYAQWLRNQVKLNRVECFSHGWSADREYARALVATTLATEFDFYCRVTPPNGEHIYWNSQSPAGKLAKRTITRKRATKKSNARKRNGPPNSLLQELTQALNNENTNMAEEKRLVKWENRTKNKQKALSKRHAKATSKRASKNKPNNPD
ncbi:TPA: hypothetical protein RJR38_003097 [Burkholderia multivorans]|nr:hypothetical protein [Burkholderia multivorans]